MINRSATARPAVFVLLVLMLAACGGDSAAVAVTATVAGAAASDEAPTAPRSPPICSAVAGLELTSVQPLDAVLFKGTTATHVDDVDLVALIDSGDGSGPREEPLQVLPAPRNGWRFVAPVNPLSPFQESQVLIRLRAAGEQCGEWSLTLLPLERAPGTLAKLTGRMDGTLTEMATLMGYSRSEVAQRSWAELPPEAQALRVLLEAFDGEGHDGSAMAHFRRAQSELDNPGAEMMEALVAKSGVADKVLDLQNELRARASGVAATNQFIPRPPSRALDWLGIASAHAAPPMHSEKPDAALLGHWMDMQLIAEIAATSDQAQSYLNGAKLLTTLGGILPAAFADVNKSAKWLDRYYRTLGAVIAAQDLAVDMLRHVLPSKFVEMQVELADDSYWEDATDLDGRWLATVTATSRDWNADEAMTSMLMSIGGGKAQEKAIGKFGSEKLLKEMASDLKIGPMLGALQDLISGPLITEALGAQEGRQGLLNVSARTFGPTDVSEEAFSERELLHGSEKVLALTGHNTYRAIAAGAGDLTVKVRSERFGQQSILRTAAIQVPEIEVSVRPATSTVQPGDSLVFVAAVDMANDRRVHWTVEPAYVHQVIVLPDTTGGPDRARITFSENTAHFPVRVTATAMSRDGLRSTGIPQRQGFATVGLETVTIEPMSACVETGNNQQFTAHWGQGGGRGALPSPSWSAQRGRVGNNGRYRAPSEAGVDRVEVVDRANPERRASVEVRVMEDCRCGFTLNGEMGRHHGDIVGYDLGIGMFNMGSDRPGVPMVSVMMGIPISRPGLYPLSSFGGDGSRISVAKANGEIWMSVGGQLEITQFGSDSASGRFSGPVAHARDMAVHDRDPARNPLKTSTASLTFQVHRNPEQSYMPGMWACGPDWD